MIIVHHNSKTGEFFFSTDHYQKVKQEGFVPTSFRTPFELESGEERTEDGFVKTKEDVVNIFYSEENNCEIPNPNPELQA